MHSVLLGVIKSFFRYWFGSDYTFQSNDSGKRKKNIFNLRQYIKQIDSRLLKIKPPSFVPVAPRSIETWPLWHAHEFFNFIIYYSLGVFHEIMESEYYQHLVILVIIMENIFKSCITQSDLNSVQELIVEFISKMEELYPERSLLSGVHELLHLVKCTKDFGPLNSCCCFPFEELNRKILRLINGHDLIGEEFIKLFMVAQTLSSYTVKSNNSAFTEFIKSHSTLKTSNFKNNNRKTDIKFTGSITKNENEEISALIHDFDGSDIRELELTNRVIYNGIKYTTYENVSKFCDYCVYSEESEFGLIKDFIKDKNKLYVLCQKIVKIYEPFKIKIKKHQAISNVFICDRTEEYFVTTIELVKKVCFFEINELCFISTFNASHLFS